MNLIADFNLKKGFCVHTPLTQSAKDDATAQHFHGFSFTTPAYSIRDSVHSSDIVFVVIRSIE